MRKTSAPAPAGKRNAVETALAEFTTRFGGRTARDRLEADLQIQADAILRALR